MNAVCCPNCGAPVRPGSARCEYCGSWFESNHVETVIMYADNKPVMIVEKISEEVAEETRRQAIIR